MVLSRFTPEGAGSIRHQHARTAPRREVKPCCELVITVLVIVILVIVLLRFV